MFRNPADDKGTGNNLGSEINLTLPVKSIEYMTLQFGYSRFFSGDIASAIFNKQKNLDWFYAQATVNFNDGK